MLDTDKLIVDQTQEVPEHAELKVTIDDNDEPIVAGKKYAATDPKVFFNDEWRPLEGVVDSFAIFGEVEPNGSRPYNIYLTFTGSMVDDNGK